MAESNKNQKREEVYEKIEVEIVPSTNVKNVADLKKRIEAEKIDSKTNIGNEKNETDNKRPKKKWKKQDFINSGQMPPANKLVPAIILLVMLVGTYVGFNSLVVDETEFKDDETSKTGWDQKIAELGKKYAKQQDQLLNLQNEIIKHSNKIGENKSKIGKNIQKINETETKLKNVHEEMKDMEKKSKDERLELYEKQDKLRKDLDKLEDEQKKMKETDEQLKNDVKELDNKYREAERKMDLMAGDIEKGNEERQKMKEDFQRLLTKLREQGIKVPDYGSDEEKNQP